MIGLLILARMGSGRLAQKHLIEANHKPLLYWLIKRFETEFEAEIKARKVCLIISSSEKPENKNFSVVIQDTSCQLFQGSDNNIPLRQLQCATHFNLTGIISIDGDDILCSTHAARIIYEQLSEDREHTLFTSSGLPIGMNISGFPVSYLRKCLNESVSGTIETGWGRIFKDPKTRTTSLGNYDIMGDLRFTLDYPEDAAFFCEIINALKEKILTIRDQELITFVMQHDLSKINSFLKDQYWENYTSEKAKETDPERNSKET